MRQNEAQFQAIWGEHRDEWSKACNAGYTHLFKGETRTNACSSQEISRQALSAFMKRNKYNHAKYVEYHALGIPLAVADMLTTERLTHEQKLIESAVKPSKKTKRPVNVEANHRKAMLQSIDSTFDE